MNINNFDFYSGLSLLEPIEDSELITGQLGVLASHINEQNKEVFWINLTFDVVLKQDGIYPVRIHLIDTVDVKKGGAIEAYEERVNAVDNIDDLFLDEDVPEFRMALSQAVDKKMIGRRAGRVYVDNAGLTDDTENMHISGKIFAYIDNAGEIDGDVYGLSINNEVRAYYNKRGYINLQFLDVIEARRVFPDSYRKDEYIDYQWDAFGKDGDNKEDTLSAIHHIEKALFEFIEENDNVLRVQDDETDYEYLMWELTDSQFDMGRWSNASSNEKNKNKGTALLTLVRERLRIEVLNDTKKKKKRKDYVEVRCIIGYGDIAIDEVLMQAEPTLKSINQAIERGIVQLDFAAEVPEELFRGW